MPGTGTAPKLESVTFRIDTALKAELVRLADRDHRSLGEFLRALAHERVRQERRRAFETEARRQCQRLAERSRDQSGEEAEVLRWIEDVADTEGWQE